MHAVMFRSRRLAFIYISNRTAVLKDICLPLKYCTSKVINSSVAMSEATKGKPLRMLIELVKWTDSSAMSEILKP